MSTIAEDLLRQVEEFLERHQMSPSRFGHLACRDYHAVRRLRAGLGVTSGRIDKIRAFMASFEGNGRKAPASRGGHVAVRL